MGATELVGAMGSEKRKATVETASILSREAREFVCLLHRKFNPERESCLRRRAERQSRIDSGVFPDFLKETESVRSRDWRVAPAPQDLENRQVEITGPVERKMMINGLNSGARVFMADFEDSCSPTWENMVQGQANLKEAVRKTLGFISPDGKTYALKNETATLMVRPRGWHLEEKNFTVDGKPCSGSLFDFGLYFFHNARELIARGSGPYFYLPKLESHLEARLWNDVFAFAQETLGIPRGTIRATVLIETILAAFEMDEILFELREHAAGLNAGRWDYIFSIIKKFRGSKDFILPDRVQVTMTAPFMRAYSELLVKTCHRRGAHAMGGMAAFIPSRKDAEVNRVALEKVREDKEREARDGFDGTWVAHPDLVPVAAEIFRKHLGDKPHQKIRLRDEVRVSARDLLNTKIPGGKVTEHGFRHNVNVALQYLDRWLSGTGAAALFNLMEDVATAEISRAQLWQWVRHKAALEGGRSADAAFYETIRSEELQKLGGEGSGKLGAAAAILDDLVLNKDFTEFLTIPAYRYLG